MECHGACARQTQEGRSEPYQGRQARRQLGALVGALQNAYSRSLAWTSWRCRFRCALTAQRFEQYRRLVVPVNCLPHTSQVPSTLRRAIANWRPNSWVNSAQLSEFVKEYGNECV